MLNVNKGLPQDFEHLAEIQDFIFQLVDKISEMKFTKKQIAKMEENRVLFFN